MTITLLVTAFASADHPRPKFPSARSECAELAKRLNKLEWRLAALERENAELRRFIIVNDEDLAIQANGTITVDAGTSFTASAGTDATLESAGTTTIRGAVVEIN